MIGLVFTAYVIYDSFSRVFAEYPNNNPTKHLVRVYVVKGLNLTPKDFSGKSDPYVVINCGNKKLGDRSSYVPKSIDPIFGR